MLNKRKLSVFLVVIIIAAVVVGLITDSQEPSQNTNPATSTAPISTGVVDDIADGWKTYSNAQLNVTLQHPPSASVQTEGPGNRYVKVTYLGSDNATGEITDGFTLTVASRQKNADTPLRSFVESEIENSPPPEDASSISTTTFRNQQAFSYSTETIGVVEHTVFSPANDRVISISSNVSDPNDKNYQKLVEQITHSLDFSPVSGGDGEPSGTLNEVTLVMLDTDVSDGQQPERGCDMLAPITRSIEPTQAPLTAAMEELFALKRTNVERFYNFIAKTNDTLSFERATVENGTANIYLTGELSGLVGVCDNPRAAVQIEETALRFPTVEDVQIYLNGEQTDLLPSER